MCVSTAHARTKRVSRDGVRHFSCKFSHKMALLKCPCAFRLRMLAQNVCRGMGSGIFRVNFVHVRFDCACSHKTCVAGLGSGIFRANFHTKWLFSNVHVRFDCAGSHKVCFPVLGSVFLLNILLLLITIIIITTATNGAVSFCLPTLFGDSCQDTLDGKNM